MWGRVVKTSKSSLAPKRNFKAKQAKEDSELSCASVWVRCTVDFITIVSAVCEKGKSCITDCYMKLLRILGEDETGSKQRKRAATLFDVDQEAYYVEHMRKVVGK